MLKKIEDLRGKMSPQQFFSDCLEDILDHRHEEAILKRRNRRAQCSLIETEDYRTTDPEDWLRMMQAEMKRAF
jgi:hypothetical protein